MQTQFCGESLLISDEKSRSNTTMTAIMVNVCEGEMETCVCSFKGTLGSLGEFRSALVLPHWGGPGGGAPRRGVL